MTSQYRWFLNESRKTKHKVITLFQSQTTQIVNPMNQSNSKPLHTASVKRRKSTCASESRFCFDFTSDWITKWSDFSFYAHCLRPWQTRTHCCGHIVAFTNVCPRAQHLLQTQILCPGHKKMFLILFRNILCPQQMFPSFVQYGNTTFTLCPARLRAQETS